MLCVEVDMNATCIVDMERDQTFLTAPKYVCMSVLLLESELHAAMCIYLEKADQPTE